MYNLKREGFIYDHELKLEYLKNKNQIEKERNQKFKLQIIISILLIILLLSLIIFLFIRNRKNKLLEEYRIENDALEKEKLKIEKLIAEKENTSKAMFLLEKDNLIHQISNKLKETLPKIKEENQNVLQGVINELKGAVNVKRWEEFELRFNKVNPTFFENLKSEFPNLTLNERKLCALLSMQMSTKEISNITGQTNHSINIARGRLRKKLNIDHTEVELVEFLNKYNR
jgi:DNA-binding CsgD family transcriptional regulator